jgi:uncharacterized protein YxjI
MFEILCFQWKGRVFMKLYMQKDGFRWDTPMVLTDRNGRTRYQVSGDAYSLGKRLHVTDLSGREAIYIQQQVPSLFPRYEISVYGRPVTEIVKDLTFVQPKYTMGSLEWELMGILGTYDYEIVWQSSQVAACRPQEDRRLVLELGDRTTELTALGILLTINCIFAAQERKHL